MDTTKAIDDHLHIVFVAFVVASIVFWIAWRLGFFKLSKEVVNGSLTIWEVLGAFGVFFSVGVFVTPVAALVWMFARGESLQKAMQMPMQGWFNLITMLITALAVAAYVAWIPERAQHAIGRHIRSGGVPKILHDFALGACSWLISYPLVVFIGEIIAVMVLLEFPTIPIDQVAVKYLKGTMNYPVMFLFTAFFLVFVVPIVEEIIFRGFLQTWLRQYLSVFHSILCTSAIFAAFHFSSTQGIANFELLVSLFVLSCFLGFLYERQQSLMASIGLHITFNGISVITILSV